MSYAFSQIDGTLSLGPLHLKLRTFKILAQRGINTTGELIQLVGREFVGDKFRLSPTAAKDVLNVMNRVSQSIDVDGNVNVDSILV